MYDHSAIAKRVAIAIETVQAHINEEQDGETTIITLLALIHAELALANARAAHNPSEDDNVVPLFDDED